MQNILHLMNEQNEHFVLQITVPYSGLRKEAVLNLRGSTKNATKSILDCGADESNTLNNLNLKRNHFVTGVCTSLCYTESLSSALFSRCVQTFKQ